MEEVKQKENGLAKQLKDCCDVSRKEVNLAKSTQIIYQLGLNYKKRSPDKISLLQSVGLLNAAIARQPSNISQIKIDLSEVCQHILQLSGAKRQTVDLIEKGKEVKTAFIRLRKDETGYLNISDLKQIPVDVKAKTLYDLQKTKIRAVQNIYIKIASEYLNIMANLSGFCENIMGIPPCKYSVAGMGSLAREEITPYSDFEHIFLMKEQENYLSNIEYFRWYSVIFHVIVLNMQETIIPSLNIASLNNTEVQNGDWFYDARTPRGVSFDGMMPHACKFPLGKLPTKNKPWPTELIKTVSGMLNYLSSEEVLKNGYHLSDILTKTCLVYGNLKVYEQFAERVRQFLTDKSQDERTEDVKLQVKEDLSKFSTRFRLANLKSYQTINIKQLVYRSSTLFIAALKKIHNVSANSCFNIITKLSDKYHITNKAKHKLLYAIAIACEMRLSVYMSNQSQCDNAFVLQLQRRKAIEDFLDIVGQSSTVNYFQIAYCLQCEVVKHLEFTKLHFYSNPQLINLTICFAFGIRGFKLDTPEDSSFTVALDRKKFDFDVCLEQVENDLRIESNAFQKIAKRLQTRFPLFLSRKMMQSSDVKRIKSMAECLYSNGLHDEALELFKFVLTCCENKSNNGNMDENTAEILNCIGLCLSDLHQNKDALTFFDRSLEIQQSITSDETRDSSLACTLNNIGICLCDLHQTEDALRYFKRSMEIDLVLCADEERGSSFATKLNNIGLCMRDMQKFNEALTYFNKSLEIDRMLSVDEENEREIAITLNNIGLCLRDLHQYDNAIISLKRALAVFQITSQDKSQDRRIAITLNNIGFCTRQLKRFDEALIDLNRSLAIHESLSLDEDKDLEVAITLHNIGLCHHDMCQYAVALKYFKRSVELYQNISTNKDEDRDVAILQKSIGYSLLQLREYDDALLHLKRSQEIYQRIPLSKKTDKAINSLQSIIDNCLMSMSRK